MSLVADDLAVVYLPQLPVALWELLRDLGIRMVEVPDEEYGTLACNVLAVRPGVAVMVRGNPRTERALRDTQSLLARFLINRLIWPHRSG